MDGTPTSVISDPDWESSSVQSPRRLSCYTVRVAGLVTAGILMDSHLSPDVNEGFRDVLIKEIVSISAFK